MDAGRYYDPLEAATRIKEKALQLGFSACGIARVRALSDDSDFMQKWLHAGHHGKMSYLANHSEKRDDPSLLVPGAKSVIAVLLNYATDTKQQSQALKVAQYARGSDYHYIVKQFLGDLYRFICEEIAPAQGRVFCDSAPVLERRWAYEAGLGWIGMNHCLIHPQFGSFCFIGELIVDLELEYDQPLKGDCGNCGHCVKQCPTKAIEPHGFLKANQCISYLTVELKDEVPESYRSKLGGSIVGCDVCQDVCPWNRKAACFTSSLWKLDENITGMSDEAWLFLEKGDFKQKFAKSSLSRLGYNKLIQNCRYAIEVESADKRHEDGITS